MSLKVSDSELSNNGSSKDQSFVLNPEMGRHAVSTVNTGKGNSAESGKSLAALRNHSEAERRRRGKINGHLATLRDLLPRAEKMDKAALLAEVIDRLKDLKKQAMEARETILLPTDQDEVKVECITDGGEDEVAFLKAYICCNYRSDILSDIKRAMQNLHLRMVKSEISTLGGRLINVILFAPPSHNNGRVSWEMLAKSIEQTLISVVVEQAPASSECSRIPLAHKKRR